MKKIFLILLMLLNCASLFGATPEAEKAFVEDFKKMFETKDQQALASLIYKENADPVAFDFLFMKVVDSFRSKITAIDLVEFTPDEAKTLGAKRQLPAGGYGVFNLPPLKKMLIQLAAPNGRPTTITIFVAGKDGRVMMTTLMPVK